MICYSESTKQQSERIKYVHKCQNKEQKRNTVIGSSRFRMHSYWNRQAASKGKKNQDKTNG